MTVESFEAIRAEAARIAASPPGWAARRSDPSAFVWRAPRLEVDVSRQPLDDGALRALMRLGDERGLSERFAALFSAEIVNASEGRPALHWALRGGADHLPRAAGLADQARKALAFARSARAGELGFPVRSILHVGIGGSDLGPRLVWDALRSHGGEAVELRFCANVDPDDFAEATSGLDPATTLVVVVSKSFTTPETAANAALARNWLVSRLGSEQADRRLAAVSSAPKLAMAWGAAADRIFPMDEAVGGRYSVWSSVGLSLMIALGEDLWRRFLAGGAEMDAHVRDAPLAENVAARLAMMDIFLHSALGVPSRTVLAYAHRLRRLPDYLQQLEMESNGKSAPDDALGLLGPTAPVVWGSVGTLGQHSFHQLLHQGQRDTAIEFVASFSAGSGDRGRGRALLANAFAQSEALLLGRSSRVAEAMLLSGGMKAERAARQAPHMHMPGGRGSTMILLDETGPEALGALLALYEHRTFAAGVLWGINPFDQWGVERGKVLAAEFEAAIETGEGALHDPSTRRLVALARERGFSG
jgi:glucose-6-phosphate isomerase